MSKMFNGKGRLNIPIKGEINLPEDKVARKKGEYVINQAYCPKGHSLISDVKIDNQKSLHFIYTNKNGTRETDILLSPVVRKCRKKILKGEPFKKGEITKVLCPACRAELPILFNCECGAPIYLFYIDTHLDPHIGQSFCSRIGCVKSSQLRFSDDVLKEFMSNYRL